MKESQERWMVRETTDIYGTQQQIWRCANGYGASILRGDRAYGGFELAVIKFPGFGDRFEITYNTPITDNVIGWLDDDQCDALIDQIAAL